MLWIVLAQQERGTPGAVLSQMIIEPLLKHSPIGVAVLDADLRYVWVNDWLEYGGAVPRGRRLGRRVRDVSPNAERIEALMRQVLATGKPVLDVDFLGPSHVDPGRRHAWRMSVFPLEGSPGQFPGVWYIVLDVTERWRARERALLLTEASARVGSTLDIERTAEELADVVVPHFADGMTIHLDQLVFRGKEPRRNPLRRDHGARCAAYRIAAGNCPKATAAEVGEALGRLTESFLAGSLGDGGTLVLPLEGPAQEHAELGQEAHARGIHSVLVTPVQARGVRLGAVTFARAKCTDPFDEGDVDLAEALVARAAVCLDNARRFVRERRAALALQRSLLPRRLVTGAVLDIASRYFPADAPYTVGGDWFDVIPLSGARVALVVGDVVGHGIHAAVAMGRLRTAVRTLADLDLPPDELLAHLDDLVISLSEEEDAEAAEDEEQSLAASVLGATCLYAVYDPVARRCELARAGHLPPVLASPDGSVTILELPAGPPLGLGFLPFESTEVEVPDGAVLALFTDGLLDAGDGDLDTGLARLTDALSYPGREPEELCAGVVDALLTGAPRDDAALLVARVRGLDAEHVVVWDVPADPAVVATAREHVAGQLDEWGLGGLQFTTELIVSELVTNAIRYGDTPIRLRLIWHTCLICEVSDGSSTSPRLRHARTTDEGGRGLFLIAQLARRWGTRYTATGKTIWAEQSPTVDGFNGG
jgi:sodium/proline symporter